MDNEEKDINESVEANETADESLMVRVDDIEKTMNFLADFCKMQVKINNCLRFLVRRKYSEKELDEALKEFEEHEKHLQKDEK